MNIHTFRSSLKPPSFVFIEITRECNLKCKQCHMWMTRDNPKKSLASKKKVEIIEQFHDLNPRGTVVFTGGETMKKTDEFFLLSEKCRELNLASAANTNGTYIINELIAQKCVDYGPQYLVVSLDSHLKEKHDYLRGQQGTFDQVIKSISLLLNAKADSQSAKNVRIMINSILCDLNYQELDDLVHFAKKLDVDGITFQIIGRTFYKQTKNDPAFELFFPKDRTLFKQKIDEFANKYSCDSFVCTTKNDFEWMKLYVDNPDFIGEPVCSSHENNMMIDVYGEVQLCFGMRELLDGKSLGNVKKLSLRELWFSSIADDARNIMKECRKNCGMLNCHRKTEA